MRLVLDNGNTRVKVSIFDGDNVVDFLILAQDDYDQLPLLIQKYEVASVIMSSVAQPLDSWQQAIASFQGKVVVFDQDTKLPFDITYATPKTLGRDRIADIAAVSHLGKNALVIDSGTCITYNYLIDGGFQGGAIAPGLKMRFKALNQYTKRLPLIEDHMNPKEIGDSTHDSIKSGVVNGVVFEMEGRCNSFLAAYPEAKVYLTGGDAIYFAEQLKNPIFADPLLTLRGLKKILEFNEK